MMHKVQVLDGIQLSPAQLPIRRYLLESILPVDPILVPHPEQHSHIIGRAIVHPFAPPACRLTNRSWIPRAWMISGGT